MKKKKKKKQKTKKTKKNKSQYSSQIFVIGPAHFSYTGHTSFSFLCSLYIE